MGYNKWNDVSYDNTLFEVKTDGGERGNEYLHYIGAETDARKIQLPPQLQSLYMMFAGTDVEHGPYIPDGVTDVRFMFEDAQKLVEGSVVPDSVKYQAGMYDGCVNLSDAKNISKGAENIDCMFSDCISLAKVPEIPDSVISAIGTFAGCENVREVHGGCNVKDARNIYAGMSNLEIPAREMNPEADMTDAFTGCIRIHERMEQGGSDIGSLPKSFGIDLDNYGPQARNLPVNTREKADPGIDREAMASELVGGIVEQSDNVMDYAGRL